MLTLFLSLVQDALFFLGYLSGQSSFPKPLSAKEERTCIARMRDGDDACPAHVD